MIYLILQQLLLCATCLMLGILSGWLLWGLQARQRSQHRAELARQSTVVLSLQEQAQKDKRKLAELETIADEARKFAAKKESSVTQLIADKGSLLADVRNLEKEIARLKSK